MEYNMSKIKLNFILIMWILCALWLILSIAHANSYELGTNDCSNMVYRAEKTFDMLGVNTTIGEKSTGGGYSHVWIIVNLFGYSIPYETITLTPSIDFWNYKPDRVYQSTSEIVSKYPDMKNQYCE